MNKLVACAFALFAAIALFSPDPARAQATQAITTQDGNCFGVAGDGRSIIIKRCGNRFNVAVDGNQLVAFLPNGNEGMAAASSSRTPATTSAWTSMAGS